MRNFPTPLDAEKALAGLLGTFWSRYFQGKAEVHTLCASIQDLYWQASLDVEDAINCASRFEVPVYRRGLRTPIKILQSELSDRPWRLNDTGITLGQSDLLIGGTVSDSYSVELPENVVSVAYLTDKLRTPSFCWVCGVNFVVDDSRLYFLSDPFALESLEKTAIYVDGVISDWEATLWLHWELTDEQYLHDYVGYLLSVSAPGTAALKTMLNAVLDAIYGGAAFGALEKFIGAITGQSFCETDGEVVEAVITEFSQHAVVTDVKVYFIPETSTASVAVGDILTQGQPLSNAAAIYPLNQGTVPDLSGLAMTDGMIDNRYGGVVFFNTVETPTITSDVDGLTVFEFPVGGDETKIDAFWVEVHRRGVASGRTLAQMLDTRENPEEEPTAAHLPATINPFEFLCTQLLRNHGVVVHIDSGAVDSAEAFRWLDLLRLVVSPEALVLFSIDMPYLDDDAEEPETTLDVLDDDEVSSPPDLSTDLPEPLVTIEAPRAFSF